MIICVVGAGLTSGTYSVLTGDSAILPEFISGFALGTLGTLLGTFLDVSMYNGFDLGAVNYIFTIFTGTCVEAANWICELTLGKALDSLLSVDSGEVHYIPSNGVGGGKELGSKPLAVSMIH